jgi:Mitochondrial biogenesis AIM24
VATAYPVNGGQPFFPSNNNVAGSPHFSAVNSSVYQGGPTGGLVSEGNPVKCHKIDYEIRGHEMQLVEVELDPGRVVIGEAGAMMFLEDGIKFETKFGDGSDPKVRIKWDSISRAQGVSELPFLWLNSSSLYVITVCSVQKR